MFFKNILARLIKSNNDKDVDSATVYLKRFAKDIIRPNLKKILVALFFMAIFSGATAAMAWMIKPIINNIFVFKSIKEVFSLGFGVMGISFVKGIAQFIYASILSAVAIGVISEARYNLYESFLKQDLSFFQENPPGTLISVTMNDINAISNLATNIPINFGRDLLTFIGLFGVMFYQQPVYSLFILASVFFIIIPIRLVSKKLKGYFTKTNTGFAVLTSRFEQVFHGIKEVKSYNMEEAEKQSAKGTIAEIARIQQKVRRAGMILPAFMELISGVSIGGILIYGGYQSISNGADAGTFFSFIAALLLSYQPLKRLSEFTTTIQLGTLAVKRYYSFIDAKPKILVQHDAKIINFKKPTVSFRKVSFAYHENHLILKNISFTIGSGKKFALVGRSGGGKSTIINLLERFYDPSSGSITINDIDLKDINIKSLRNNISYVGQDLALFDDTIYNNIIYGTPNTTKEDVEIAAQKAFCTEFITKLPNGFNTEIGSRGTRLSGGQRQRISIARALLKNAPILLLDEATSALDTESEQKIQNALNALMENKTTLVIAHRLSTIINSDIILVVDKGKIIEHGNHTELIKKDGFYKYLYNLQFKD